LVALYVTSPPGAVGKTTICAGLCKHLLNDAKKVGYFKPITHDGGIDNDATFMKHILGLEESIESICPIISDQGNLADSVKEVYAKISSGKEVVMVEGIVAEASYRIIEALDARVVIVESYSDKLPLTKFTDSYKDFGEHLLGVILNKVPRSQLERISAQFGETGINILGLLPEDRVLFTLTIGELAEHIQGETLNCAEKSAELIENFMLGAMCVDPGPEYFGRKTNKAVVVRGERPDMQLAALDTSTKCLVLSGNVAPIPAVLYSAEEKGIPIILTKSNVIATVMNIEEALGKARFNQEKKLSKLIEIVEQHLNFQAVYKGLGLTA